MHVRGPAKLKQFAVYTPSGSSNSKRSATSARRHAHAHAHAQNAAIPSATTRPWVCPASADGAWVASDSEFAPNACCAVLSVLQLS